MRLTALIAEPKSARALRMLMRIRHDLDELPEPGPWLVALRSLLDDGTIGFDSLCYLSELLTECVILWGSERDPELVALHDAKVVIERAAGLADGDGWYLPEAPANWLALNERWDARAASLVQSCLRANGLGDVATIWENSPSEFDGRAAQGRTALWPDVPSSFD
ncbi:MAG TPA: hypothetical protein VE869_15480 [Gemmatimonas sp.]|nr:hypothetical protein [Gemmatimonas sp.]